MSLPTTNFSPPFDITRSGHIVLRARDLSASKAFYTEVIGLLVTDETADTVWLRGVEESAHHSLVLKRTDGEALCERVGLRVRTDEDLERAKAHFDRVGIDARFVEVAHQGATLQFSDPNGVPLELVARMHPRQPRHHHQPNLHKGAGALRLDHFQMLTPDVVKAGQFYADLGFRVSDYFVASDGETPLGLFMYRKNNPHDLVFLTRPGPVMHHVAYIVPDPSHIFRALDWSAAGGQFGSLGRGPGRHGQGHSLYAYLRDPDGHRIEILPPAIQHGDIDDEPVKHDRPGSGAWELPPPKSWLFEAKPFVDVPITGELGETGFFSLEDYLARKNGRHMG